MQPPLLGAWKLLLSLKRTEAVGIINHPFILVPTCPHDLDSIQVEKIQSCVCLPICNIFLALEQNTGPARCPPDLGLLEVWRKESCFRRTLCKRTLCLQEWPRQGQRPMDLRGSRVNFSLGNLPAADKQLKIKVPGIMLKHTAVGPVCFADFGGYSAV